MRIDDLHLLAGPGAASLAEELSVLSSPEPLVLDRPAQVAASTLEAAAATLSRLPAPTVLVAPTDAAPALLDAVDVCLTDEPDPPRPWVHAAPEEIVGAVRRQPLVALGLVALMRASQHLPVYDALAAESATYALLLGSQPFREWLAQRGRARPKGHERPPIAVTRRGDLVTVTLDRPDARNAVDTVTRDALVEALGALRADPGIQIEVRGRGPSFSAGGDLHEFGTVGDPAVAHAVRLTRHPGAAMHAVAARTTCFLHGACVGAGVELPAFAGTVVADPSALFRLPEVGMGLIPGAGGTVSLPRRIGRHRTGWLALTGAWLDAVSALAWGLVDRVEPVDGDDPGTPC